MAKSYKQIVDQIKSLQAQADEARRKEVAGVVSRIKEALSFYGLSATDLGLGDGVKSTTRSPKLGGRPKASTKSVPRTAKYADGPGKAWVGRGPRPLWLREALASGRKLEEFLVDGAGEAAPPPVAAKRRPRKGRGKRGGPVPAKYSDGNGRSWSGRGPQPGWLKESIAGGKSLEAHAV